MAAGTDPLLQPEAKVEIISIRDCQLKNQAGEKFIQASAGLLSRDITIPLSDVRTVLQYRNLLQINHDNGIVRLADPDRETCRPLIETLKALPDADFRELDYAAPTRSRLAALAGAAIFYIIIPVVIAGVAYLIADDEKRTQPLTYLLYLLPAFCIAHLARRGFTATLEAVGERLENRDGRKQSES